MKNAEKYILQVKEEPAVIPVPNTTTLRPIFASDTIQVEKEEEAFPFISLVADCGGILGLFIGFNFLMVWDWLFNIIIRITNKRN